MNWNQNICQKFVKLNWVLTNIYMSNVVCPLILIDIDPNLVRASYVSDARGTPVIYS